MVAVIHSFAHGGTTYSLRHDYASILKAMEREPKQADKVLVRLARFADLDYSDRARLVTRAHELSGVGKRAINADLKAALAEQSEYDDEPCSQWHEQDCRPSVVGSPKAADL
jgi:hypothetical protein